MYSSSLLHDSRLNMCISLHAVCFRHHHTLHLINISTAVTLKLHYLKYAVKISISGNRMRPSRIKD